MLAGHKQHVFQQLLMLAEQRAVGLETRAAEGDVATIDVVENEQNLLRRKALLNDARRRFDIAAIALSLYLRDANGGLQIPHAETLPASFPEFQSSPLAAPPLIQRVLANRPELLLLDNQGVLERKRLLLAENELKPRIDLALKGAHDMSGGSRSRDGFDAVIALEVSVPLQRRRGLGLIVESRSRLRQLAIERRLAGEQLANEVRKLVTDINAAHELSAITNAEFDRAQQMVVAERKRFADGASDLFLVNLREERGADAKIRHLEARARLLNKLTDLQAITLDFAALRI
jgi:outer membrane protein TolC